MSSSYVGSVLSGVSVDGTNIQMGRLVNKQLCVELVNEMLSHCNILQQYHLHVLLANHIPFFFS